MLVLLLVILLPTVYVILFKGDTMLVGLMTMTGGTVGDREIMEVSKWLCCSKLVDVESVDSLPEGMDLTRDALEK